MRIYTHTYTHTYIGCRPRIKETAYIYIYICIHMCAYGADGGADFQKEHFFNRCTGVCAIRLRILYDYLTSEPFESTFH